MCVTGHGENLESFERKCGHTLCLKKVTLVGSSLVPSFHCSGPGSIPHQRIEIPKPCGFVKQQQQQNHTSLLGTRDGRGGKSGRRKSN